MKWHPVDSHILHMRDVKAPHSECVCVMRGLYQPSGICSVMKHSRGVARGVHSTPGCKMKLWKSNLHSQRPIAFITTEALYIKGGILLRQTLRRDSSTAGGSERSFAYLTCCVHRVQKHYRNLLISFCTYYTLYSVQYAHPTH